MSTKSQQLQIRVTPGQKAQLKRLARGAGQDVSGYVLARALPEARLRFGEIIRALRDREGYRFALNATPIPLSPIYPPSELSK